MVGYDTRDDARPAQRRACLCVLVSPTAIWVTPGGGARSSLSFSRSVDAGSGSLRSGSEGGRHISEPSQKGPCVARLRQPTPEILGAWRMRWDDGIGLVCRDSCVCM